MDEKDRKFLEELLFSGKTKESFIKKLFFGIFDPHKVFPYPEPPDREKADAFLEKLSHFARESVDPVAIDKQAKIPDSVIKGLFFLGAMGMTVPKQYGGLDLSQYAYCRATETLSARCASTALFMNVHQSIGLKALLLFGTEEQKNKWLPKLVSGEAIAAFSLTEPNAGSDAGALETTAEYIPEKKVYRLNGVKQWSTNASIAGVLTVMAKTEDKITAFLVTPDMPGFEVTHQSLEKVGFRGTWTANLSFKNMEVPEENILGEKGKGLKVALTVLDYGRTTFGALCTGVAKDLLWRAINHANTRIQFKKPLASFDLVKKKLATIAANTYAMESATYLTAGMIDEKQEDIMLESTLLKVFASEALWDIIYETMQIYGGRSFFTSEPLERNMRDARLNQIGEGANEVMRAFIGVVGMRDVGMHLKEIVDGLKGHFFSTLGPLSREFFFRLKTPVIPIQCKELKTEAEDLGRAVRRFGRSVIGTLATYKEEVIEKELDLNRIAEAAIALYTASAVISRWDKERVAKDLPVAKLYLHQANKRCHKALNELFSKEDKEICSVADHLTSGVL